MQAVPVGHPGSETKKKKKQTMEVLYNLERKQGIDLSESERYPVKFLKIRQGLL